MNIRQIKKNMQKMADNHLYFPTEMYSNVYGSLIISAMMTDSENLEKRADVKKKWQEVKKNKTLIDWDFSDEKFIDKTLDFFGLKKPADFPIAFVQWGSNAVFAPYIDGVVYPIREDGLKGAILRKGKIYPISFKEKAENEN